MTEQDKRDLAKDLALCEAGTKGPVKWWRYGEQYVLEGQYGVLPVVLSTTWEETPDGNVIKDSIAIAVRHAGMLEALWPEHPDARRIAESWEGWPHAIRRAMAAEERVAELEAQAVAMRVALQAHQDAEEHVCSCAQCSSFASEMCERGDDLIIKADKMRSTVLDAGAGRSLLERLQVLEKVAEVAIDYRRAKLALDQNPLTPAGFKTWKRYTEAEGEFVAAVEELEEATNGHL